MGFLPSLFRRAQPAEARDAFSGLDKIPSWSEISGGVGYSPISVTRETAIGLPAVGKAIRLVSLTVASLPLLVYEGRGAKKKLRDDTWQFRLFNELPGMGDFSPFDFISDVSACLEASGNAFVQKVKAAGEVIALIVIDPQRVEVKRESAEKRFLVFGEDGVRRTYTASTILHIRGFTVNGSDLGLSPIALHRQRIGAVSAQEQYAGRAYGQGLMKRWGLKVPGTPNKDQVQMMLDLVKANHTGVDKAHLPIIMTNGAEPVELGLTLEDAQYVESEKLNLIQSAHIFDLPAKFLTGEGDLNEWDFIALHQVGIAPRLRRITDAFHTDPDLFPERVLYPEFDVRELVRTDAKTKAEVEHMQIQDGTKLVDEARAERGEPPLPPMPENPDAEPGKIPQVTPVGGAPTPQPIADE